MSREPNVEGSIYLKDKSKLSVIVQFLLECEYRVLVYEECGAYIVKYTHDNEEFGSDDYFLLTREEAEEIFYKRYEEKEENGK